MIKNNPEYERRRRIVNQIHREARTDCSPKAVAGGVLLPYVKIWAWPDNGQGAEFSWDTAEHILQTSKVFKLR